MLVEGHGPLGSVFSRDDFTDREVRDTDGDGLPEFVDAWGEPLQFYRWPIYYGEPPGRRRLGTSDSQTGHASRTTASAETREQDPLDPNQMLVSPAWWSSAANPDARSPAQRRLHRRPTGTSTNQCGQPAIAFMNYFHIAGRPDTPGDAGDRLGPGRRTSTAGPTTRGS